MSEQIFQIQIHVYLLQQQAFASLRYLNKRIVAATAKTANTWQPSFAETNTFSTAIDSLSDCRYLVITIYIFKSSPIILFHFCVIEYKINNKMGNIQIKEGPRKSRSIFKGRERLKSLSPFRQAISPRNPDYTKHSPIKYNHKNAYYKGISQTTQRPSDMTKNTEFKSPFSKDNTKLLLTPRNNQNTIENKWKCQEIIKKVRNFNDFLVQLKKKLQQNSHPKPSPTQFIKGQLSMNVKLENQKVELSKYKKLVQRQLSKTHSIENISIQNASNGEKVLTIQYQNIEPQNQKQLEDTFNHNNLAYYHSEQSISNNYLSQQKNIELSRGEETQRRQTGEEKSKQKMLRQAKTLLGLLKKRCIQLKKQISKHNEQDALEVSLKSLLKQKQKDMKISNLLENLQQAHKQSLTVEDKIRKLIS